MKCGTCGFECSSADAYFDHVLFDPVHITNAQKKAKQQEDKVRISRTRSKTASIRRPRPLVSA
ncbi:hypothetical protein H4R21_003803 [Coemansia helicoidea]|uniref:Uncharacterized protein n=1 Tax=Coemansia helicoidea TaxID=1286919 RepID=A0ACC1L046_9FUNG|nr:hypothetical protein H4R21_003803 [Coemansia helicoidea]